MRERCSPYREVRIRDLWLVPVGLGLLAVDFIRGRYF